MYLIRIYVVDGKANCKAVKADFPLSSAIFLHQSHDHRTLIVIIII